ncbi:MAG: phosphomannomutase [Candidatus Thiodiazotropha endolucinida]
MNNKNLSIATLMEQSGVKFGTSGARGLVDAMTDRICFAYTCAFLNYLNAEGMISTGDSVAFAGDLRSSTPRIMAAVRKAAIECGYKPVNCGFIPSPAIALYGLHQGIATIMVTGSHIPDDRNGIKFNRPDGEILKQDEAGIRQQLIVLDESLFDGDRFVQSPQLPEVDDSASEFYVQRYLNCIGHDALSGLYVGVYEHSGVARSLLVQILEGLGARVIRLGFSNTFVPVDTEAIRSEDVALAQRWSKEHALDTIVSTDGDGDRPLISDEHGQWLRGDIAGILCADYLKANWVVTPVSSNSALELSDKFAGVKRTRIGSPFVIEAMQSLLRQGKKAVVGYEANGGFLTADSLLLNGGELAPLPTRDAMIVILTILLHAKQQGLRVSGLVRQLPPRYTYSDRIKAFPTELSQHMLARFRTGEPAADKQTVEDEFKNTFGGVSTIDHTDGVRITFFDGDIVHIRPSGNAPEMRCYTESVSEARAQEMNKICINLLEGWRTR